MGKKRILIPLLALIMLFSVVSCDKLSEVKNWDQGKKDAVSGSIDDLSDSVKDISRLNDNSSGSEIVDASTGIIASLTKLFLNIF